MGDEKPSRCPIGVPPGITAILFATFLWEAGAAPADAQTSLAQLLRNVEPLAKIEKRQIETPLALEFVAADVRRLTSISEVQNRKKNRQNLVTSAATGRKDSGAKGLHRTISSESRAIRSRAGSPIQWPVWRVA